mmetsp:Transcript_42676/g.51817  ORF Transcript_42676/g.51817 Transcript_42676/m.51817 type:complete len:356 (-) Transcript_42676:115-1182(-)|eukprot:CAMPEP_0197867538 /NCGR_PEP_ID=MMETSP1438-20131217/44808_1 /TAXON_ID=1461541 /ORGANISM="Pterosperma sp., Strain CCMP1384" /LENGTH=355 /DNA_ID=CAMNT_0043486193 /DNA_START=111 /DNA_END=1178 /DNA_ORIENTATION=-
MGFKWSALRHLDAYSTAEDHLLQQTASGALVSVIGISLMVMLFANELNVYLTPYTEYEMAVDPTRGETLAIHLNMTFHGLPCSVLSLDALDMSGKHEVDISTNLYKTRINKYGKRHGTTELLDNDEDHDHDEDNPESNSTALEVAHFRDHASHRGMSQRQREMTEMIDRLKAEIKSQEGCEVHGRLDVERVAGNFHISTHALSYAVLEAVYQDLRLVNVSHTIHTLTFGQEYPGIVNPLDNTERRLDEEQGSGTFKYFLKVVPTRYKPLHGEEYKTNQYSVTEYFSPSKGTHGGGMPSAYFMYDLSAITVQITEKQRSLGHFLTRVCAVVGGVFAVTGMLDRFVHRILTMKGKDK